MGLANHIGFEFLILKTNADVVRIPNPNHPKVSLKRVWTRGLM